MNSRLVALLPILCTATLSASISLEFSFTATASGADPLGLDGATFSFFASSDDEVYSDFGGFAYLEFDTIQLTLSGSSMSDGTYSLTELNSGPIGAVPDAGSDTSILLLDSGGGPVDFTVGSFFELRNFSPYSSASVGGFVNPGDAVLPEHFDGLVVDGAGFPSFNIRTLPDLGYYSYTYAPFTVSVIPEPGVYGALAGLGALGFVAYRRKRA
ncbi:MAG: PEP-CTERM sorting domain-containing protein [Verrucomicrobiota bacterium JB022]|nr:PEP-CTERM sorting domain-containing protein [Verrucomicrobiota bacterium JB022]